MLKTITYGIMHLTVAFLVAYALSGSLIVAMSIGIIEPFVQTGFYHLHEKIWKKVEAPVPVKSNQSFSV